MLTDITSGNIDISDIPRTLSQQISATVHAGSQTVQGPHIHRIALPVPPIDLLGWLDAQSNEQKLYWSSRDGERSVAGVGVADLKTSRQFEGYSEVVGRLQSMLETSHPKARYYGGFHFQLEVLDEDLWAPFGAYRFVLPRLELHNRSGQHTLVCNLLMPEDNRSLPALLNTVDGLTFPTKTNVSRPIKAKGWENTPNRFFWHKNIQQVLHQMGANLVEKVVLARRTSFDFGQPPNPVALLQHVREQTPACFHFLIQANAQTTFLGASPERLYRRKNQTLDSESVAGTRPRGYNERDDERIAQELLQSEKERHEHRFVRKHIRSAIEPFCESIREEEELSVMKLATKQHLLSRVRGRLKKNCSDADLLNVLHPTPAVAGAPTDNALALISALEPFDRGWYAAPVGWIGSDAAEFAVAIRSGLIERNYLHLYAGAGIVEGSNPDKEWLELEQKIKDFVQILTTDQ